MPIRPENRARYPRDWKTAIVPSVGARSGWRCEGSPAYPACRAAHGEAHPVTGSRVVLTVAHLDHDDLETRDIGRMRHWCQRCHNTFDAPARAAGIRARRLAREAPQLSLPFPPAKGRAVPASALGWVRAQDQETGGRQQAWIKPGGVVVAFLLGEGAQVEVAGQMEPLIML